MLYRGIADHCTNITCPIMTAGDMFEVHWTDSELKGGGSASEPVRPQLKTVSANIYVFTKDACDDVCVLTYMVIL